MKKAKTTKRALLSGVLALLMCVSSFVGTTFAWFTDSVTSANNVITAGNLDLKVEYSLDGKTWADLDGASDLFSKGLWEPGHTEVVALKVTNAGSLALKYVAGMNVTKETIGKTKDGKDIKLSDILTVSTLRFADAGIDPLLGMNIAEESVKKAFENEDGIAYDAPVEFSETSILGSGNLLPKGETEYVLVKVDMDETVGNEANHDGKNVPTIEFGIEVVATQYTAENDSFGNDYDAEAWADAMLVANEAELQYALDNCKDVILGEDITLTKYLNIANAGEIKIDLNGKKLARNGGTMLYINNAEAVVEIYDYSVVDTGVIDATTNEVKGSQAVYVNAGVVNIYSGSFKASAECVYAMGTGKANIYGGSFMGSESFTLNKKDSDRATTEINVYGGEFLNFNPADNKAENAGTNFCAEGYVSTKVYVAGGNILYRVGAIAQKNTDNFIVEPGADVEVKDEVITGNIVNNGGDLTVSDTTVNNTTNHAYVGSLKDGGTTVFENVDATNASGGGLNIGNSSAVFKSGTISLNNTKSRHMFYVGTNNGFAELTIEGGTFELLNKTTNSSYLVASGEGAVIYVKGGTFAAASSKKAPVQEINGGEVIITGGTFAWDPSAWVADGYQAVSNGTTWTVEAK